MISISQTNQQAIQEVYFGKIPEVKRIENAIHVFRKPYIGYYTSTAPFNDPNRYKLNKCFEDAFGFEVCDIEIYNSKFPNAMTAPLGFSIDTNPSKARQFSKRKGFKYDKRTGFALDIKVASGLMFHPDLTDGEVTAILLHEVGHNFVGAALPTVGVIQTLNEVLLGLMSFGLLFLRDSNFKKKTVIDIGHYLRKNARGLTDFTDTIGSIFRWITDLFVDVAIMSDVLMAFTMPIAVWTSKIQSYIQNLIQNNIFMAPYLLLAGYNDERFSDSFAAMYGYGPELTSALAKISLNPTKLFLSSGVRDIPVISNWVDLVGIVPLFVINGIDVHPELSARFENTIRQLEHDAKSKTHSPEMRRRLEHDIRVIKTNYKRLITTKSGAEAVQDKDTVKKLYWSWLAEIGGDFKHHFYTASNPEGINNNFKNLAK